MAAWCRETRAFYFILLFYFICDGVSLLLPRLECNAWSQLTTTSTSWVEAILLSASQVTGITGTHHHAQLIFIFLVEIGFHHVGQAGLKLLTSGDPPTLTSQSAGITGISHCTPPVGRFLITDSIFIVIGLLKFSISSWFSLGSLYVSRNLTISSGLSNFLAYNCS